MAVPIPINKRDRIARVCSRINQQDEHHREGQESGHLANALQNTEIPVR